MADWHTVNTIVGPCRCGQGHLKSIHLTDGKGNFDTIWSLDCKFCRANYDLVESHLVDNPDKTIAMIRYEPKKGLQARLKQKAQTVAAQMTESTQSATSAAKVPSVPSA